MKKIINLFLIIIMIFSIFTSFVSCNSSIGYEEVQKISYFYNRGNSFNSGNYEKTGEFEISSKVYLKVKKGEKIDNYVYSEEKDIFKTGFLIERKNESIFFIDISTERKCGDKSIKEAENLKGREFQIKEYLSNYYYSYAVEDVIVDIIRFKAFDDGSIEILYNNGGETTNKKRVKTNQYEIMYFNE